MGMPSEITFPVHVLRDQTLALEAALTVCVADPAHKAVHRLRIATRRLEAQLFLLSRMSALPAYGSAAATLQRVLRQLRRAAGTVRDLDAQCKWLETAGLEPTGAGQANGMLAHGAERLHERLVHKRKRAGLGLQRLLRKLQSKAALQGMALLKSLEKVEQTAVPAMELLEHARALLRRDGLLDGSLGRTLTEDELHSVRKGAKAARYLAETMPESIAAQQAASCFEALQEAGGRWHDASELARVAKKFLGKHHGLTISMARERDRNLRLYREALRAAAREYRHAGRAHNAKGLRKGSLAEA